MNVAQLSRLIFLLHCTSHCIAPIELYASCTNKYYIYMAALAMCYNPGLVRDKPLDPHLWNWSISLCLRKTHNPLCGGSQRRYVYRVHFVMIWTTSCTCNPQSCHCFPVSVWNTYLMYLTLMLAGVISYVVCIEPTSGYRIIHFMLLIKCIVRTLLYKSLYQITVLSPCHGYHHICKRELPEALYILNAC